MNATLGAIGQHTYSIYDDGVPGVTGLLSIARAVDQQAWTFTTTSGADWWFQSAVTYDGYDAARSAFIADGQVSSFQTTGSFGAGTVSFWWKVSSETGHDFLRFSIDGTVKDEISGEVGWQQQSYTVTAGSHTLKWEYSKDSVFAEGIDAAWVDRVVLPAAQVLWTRGETGAANLWTLDPSPLSGASAVSGTIPLTRWEYVSAPDGAGAPWWATGYVHGATPGIPADGPRKPGGTIALE